ncbi:hypothetical protein ACNY44_002795 [Proteus mirabilis]
MIAVIFEVQIATSKQGQYLSLASQLRPFKTNTYIVNSFFHLKKQTQVL